MSVESQCRFEMCSAKCFLEVNNGGSGNNRISQVVPVVTHIGVFSMLSLLCNLSFIHSISISSVYYVYLCFPIANTSMCIIQGLRNVIIIVMHAGLEFGQFEGKASWP